MYQAWLESGYRHHVGYVARSICLASMFHSHKLLLITTLYSAAIYNYQLMSQRGDGWGRGENNPSAPPLLAVNTPTLYSL